MSVSIALVCEGNSDPPTICALADRIIFDTVSWVEPDEIETHRAYRGFHSDSPFLAWQDISGLASSKGVKSMGHFQGLPLHNDGHAAHKAILLLTFRRVQAASADAIIFFRDGDRQYEDRCTAVRRVRDAMNPGIPVVVGIANRMRESWLLNGYEPQDDGERSRFDEELRSIKFDPSIRAHDLSSRGESETRHPKRVLHALTGGDPDRERQCVAITSLDALRTRGRETGLADFIDELSTRLIKAFR